MKEYKTIRDSVHGTIHIKMSYVKDILDSPYMQRLRRIEQSSIRSLYPCARHDRFTHSLGVFHVGTLIAQNIKEEYKSDAIIQPIITQIQPSYEIACLTHDIGHAPFSHSFEEYYGSKDTLYKKLNTASQNALPLEVDLAKIKHHELASALLVAKIFPTKIRRIGGDVELICRMIIGVKYPDDSIEHKIKNCFIELLNGSIIDADKIDYACRDVWASGYSAAKIDVNRIAKAIHIRKNHDNDLYVVCIDHNAITDIQNVLDVKKFQNRYVLTHHSVVYEQVLLEQAALEMAGHLYPNLKKEAALKKIISVNAIIGRSTVPAHRAHGNGLYSFKHLCDDDLYFLMKHDENNAYYRELASRQYDKYALWKNPSEYYRIFPGLNMKFNIDLEKHKARILNTLQDILKEEDILLKEVKYFSPQCINDLDVIVGDANDIKKFKDICAPYYMDSPSLISKKQTFTFIFVSKKMKRRNNDIIQALTPIMTELFV